MSSFIFYSPSRTSLSLRFSINGGNKVYTWSNASGVWTDKNIDYSPLQFITSNEFDGNPHRRYSCYFQVDDAHRKNFIEGLLDGLKAKALPIIYTIENGETIRGTMSAIVEMVDIDSKNNNETALNKDITKARVKIENLMDMDDISDFDTLCWNMNIPTIGKNKNYLYLQLIKIANVTPNRILEKIQDNRMSVMNIIKRAKELKINGESMVSFDVFSNKFYCFDNPSQAFMNEDSIVDTMLNDKTRFDNFSKKVAEIYAPHLKTIQSDKKASKPNGNLNNQQEKPAVNPIIQKSPEEKMGKVEYENRLREILTRVKESKDINESEIKKEIKELKDFYISSAPFVDETKADIIYDEIVDTVFTNYKQKQKWSSNPLKNPSTISN